MSAFSLLSFNIGFVKINSKPGILIYVSLFLFAISSLYLIVVIRRNSKLENELKDEFLNSELLLSEKLVEEKENAALKVDFAHLEQASGHAHNQIDSILTLLSEKENEIRQTRHGVFQKRIDEQRKVIEYLNKRLSEDSIQAIRKMAKRDSTTQTLERNFIGNIIDRQNLLNEVEKLSILKINDALLEATNRRQKLTTKAAKTKQLKVIIQVSDQASDLNFRMFDANGKEMPLNNTNFSIEIKDPNPKIQSHAFFISPEIQINALKTVRQVELTYRCSFKLSPGFYSIMAFNGKDLVGTLRIRLE